MKELKKLIENSLDNLPKEKLDEPNYSWGLEYFSKHKKRYEKDLQIIKSEYTKGEILEIGAAPFHLTFAIKKLGFPIIALDIDPERFSEYIKINGLKVVKCDVEKDVLPFEENQFKLIIFNETFEHLRINPIRTLKKLNKILHPEGKLIISTPNLYAIEVIISYLIGRGFDNAYKQFNKLETIGHMGHVRVYSVKQLKKFLVNTGFKVERTIFRNTLQKKLWLFPIHIIQGVMPMFRSNQTHVCMKQLDF